ncbi:MAG: glycosyltransferase family 4 protein [Alphaproteobacteria bacterium]
MATRKKILIVASGVGRMGEGIVGGVTHTVSILTLVLQRLGHGVTVLAPAGSQFDLADKMEVDGNPQPTLANSDPDAPWPAVPNGLVAAMWREVMARHHHYDLVFNIQHDWLPYWLHPQLAGKLYHNVNLGRVNAATDKEMLAVARAHKGHVAFMSTSQAQDFAALDDSALTCPIFPNGLELDRYPVGPGGDYLAWAGRISPEKGLLDACEIARLSGRRIAIGGSIGDEAHWAEVQARYGDIIDYRGFLDHDQLCAHFGGAAAMLMTQKWAEAFGIVTIESLACGTPVIAVDRGANAELVRDGVTGFIIPPDDVEAGAQAVKRLGDLDRSECRADMEARFSLEALSDDLVRWIPELAQK